MEGARPKDDAPFQFTVISWNILANIWKNSEEMVEGQARMSKVIKTLLGLEADIFFIQEFEFNPAFEPVMIQALAAVGYEAFTIQRTSGKPDGLCIFIKKSTWTTEEVFPFEFNDAGQRVALLLKCTSVKYPSLHVTVCNTHLTFPHHLFDEHLRKQQTKKCLRAIHNKLQSWESDFVLFGGDFNTNKGEADDVYKILMDHNWVSSWKKVQSREVSITHRNHNAQDVPVDFVFYMEVVKICDEWVETLAPQSSRIRPIKASLFPFDTPDHVWPLNFELSDHRPLVVTFEINKPI